MALSQVGIGALLPPNTTLHLATRFHGRCIQRHPSFHHFIMSLSFTGVLQRDVIAEQVRDICARNRGSGRYRLVDFDSLEQIHQH